MDLAERGLVSDAWIRRMIRDRLGARLARARRRGEFGPAAHAAHAARHSDLPARFYAPWLGRHMKYSAALWPEGVADLDAAEEAMLELTCRRAGVEDGMDILDLSSGWGPLTLWIAERFPRTRVLAVTNSASQAAYVRDRVVARALSGVEVVQANVEGFVTGRRFDRVLSVELFEHLRNHEEMLRRIAGWLAPGGRLFVHLFAHREIPLVFDGTDKESMIERACFAGAMIPAEGLLPGCDRDLVVTERWSVGGLEYAKTLDAWLARFTAARREVEEVLANRFDPHAAARQWRRWRIFLMACSELFGFGGGNEWRVSHWLLESRRGPQPPF